LGQQQAQHFPQRQKKRKSYFLASYRAESDVQEPECMLRCQKVSKRPTAPKIVPGHKACTWTNRIALYLMMTVFDSRMKNADCRKKSESCNERNVSAGHTAAGQVDARQNSEEIPRNANECNSA
jgi:hypothetical protein